MLEIMPLVDRSQFHQILVVDGGSKDGTVEYSREQRYEVHVQRERGLRTAYREGMELVTSDVVITVSPDGNSIPELIPDLVAKLREGYDIVIVSRYLPPAKSQDDELITGFDNWFFTRLTNLLHGGNHTDAFVILRGYKAPLIRDLNLLEDDGFKIPERLFKTDIPIEPLL